MSELNEWLKENCLISRKKHPCIGCYIRNVGNVFAPISIFMLCSSVLILCVWALLYSLSTFIFFPLFLLDSFNDYPKIVKFICSMVFELSFEYAVLQPVIYWDCTKKSVLLFVLYPGALVVLQSSRITK